MGITAMKILPVLTAVLLATGCATSSPYGTAANFCETGDPAYDAKSCLQYWTAVNKSVLGSYRHNAPQDEAIGP